MTSHNFGLGRPLFLVFNEIGFPVSKIAIRYFYLVLAAFIVGLFLGIARIHGTPNSVMLLNWFAFVISLISTIFGIGWMLAMYKCAHNIPRIN